MLRKLEIQPQKKVSILIPDLNSTRINIIAVWKKKNVSRDQTFDKYTYYDDGELCAVEPAQPEHALKKEMFLSFTKSLLFTS